MSLHCGRHDDHFEVVRVGNKSSDNDESEICVSRSLVDLVKNDVCVAKDHGGVVDERLWRE